MSELEHPVQELPRTNPNGLKLALAAAKSADENRARDIVILDTRRETSMFDYLVIATGSGGRQMHAISEDIDNVLEKKLGDHRLGIEGYRDGRWILLDYGDVVIHLFDPDTRAYYSLEQLWGGADRVPFEPQEHIKSPMRGRTFGTDE